MQLAFRFHTTLRFHSGKSEFEYSVPGWPKSSKPHSPVPAIYPERRALITSGVGPLGIRAREDSSVERPPASKNGVQDRRVKICCVHVELW